MGAWTKLNEAQTRALRAMASHSGGSLQGVSWTTVRVLRHLGLCEIGPGRWGRLTREGRLALGATLALRAVPAISTPAAIGAPEEKAPPAQE